MVGVACWRSVAQEHALWLNKLAAALQGAGECQKERAPAEQLQLEVRRPLASSTSSGSFAPDASDDTSQILNEALMDFGTCTYKTPAARQPPAVGAPQLQGPPKVYAAQQQQQLEWSDVGAEAWQHTEAPTQEPERRTDAEPNDSLKSLTLWWPTGMPVPGGSDGSPGKEPGTDDDLAGDDKDEGPYVELPWRRPYKEEPLTILSLTGAFCSLVYELALTGTVYALNGYTGPTPKQYNMLFLPGTVSLCCPVLSLGFVMAVRRAGLGRSTLALLVPALAMALRSASQRRLHAPAAAHQPRTARAASTRQPCVDDEAPVPATTASPDEQGTSSKRRGWGHSAWRAFRGICQACHLCTSSCRRE